LGFQVAAVQKPLIAVKRIAEKGNTVHFGPGKADNFIQNIATGNKMMLRPNGRGSYLMDVQFVGGAKTSITVDSGAEESVCPEEWGSQFQTIAVPSDRKMNFRDASGGTIEHLGRREVEVQAPF
jgi:ribosomal protein L2